MRSGRESLVIGLMPYKFATRSRKAARVLAEHSQTTHLSLSRVGRTGVADQPGTWLDGNVRVIQVPTGEPRPEPTKRNQIQNIARVYVPAFLRLARQVLSNRADFVFVNGPALIPLGFLHRLVHRSTIVLDLPERPGMVAAAGSVASLVSKVEGTMIGLGSRVFRAATVVTYADVDIVRSMGFADVRLVRNVPLSSWKAPYAPPPRTRGSTMLTAMAMGSIFEGRGYERLIEAIGLANSNAVKLIVCGPARPDYLQTLKDLAAERQVSDQVEFISGVPTSAVSATYLRADIGLVLYESTDPGNDGLSNKLFECVSSGRPVIASDLPENRRFVTSSKVGWLVETTAESIAEALVVADDAVELESLAEHCRHLGDRSLNWETEFEPVLDAACLVSSGAKAP